MKNNDRPLTFDNTGTAIPAPLLAAAVLAVLAPGVSRANPQGGQVAHGQASFDAAVPGQLTVTNSPGAIINWQSFGIQQNEVTRFVQQSAQSAVLNRVVGQDPSQILGQLISNGRVFVINPNGILVGEGARIDTAGFIASTMNLTDENFLAGLYRFADGLPGSQIHNQGLIHATGDGSIILIAPNIRNEGVLQTEGGNIILAAGEKLTLASLNAPDVQFEVQAPQNEAVNLGQIVTKGGAAGLFAGTIRHAGHIDASSATLNEKGEVQLIAQGDVTLEPGSSVKANGPEGGDIRIESQEGGIVQSGALQANGSQGLGGGITLKASRGYSQGADIHADGETMGGAIHVEAASASFAGEISAQGNNGAGGAIDIHSQTQILHNVHSTLDASGGEGGAIREIAGQQITSSATYRAEGKEGSGGNIDLSAPAAKLLSAQLDASGASGGGQIRVGGEFQGGKNLQSDELPNAETLAVSAGAVIKADATQQGQGGTVILWSDLESLLFPSISAKGTTGHAGGFVELSSANKISWGGTVDAGPGGQVLFDPKNILIDAAAAASIQYNLTLGYNYVDLPRMKGNDLEGGDFFGSAVSLSATQLAVGAFWDDGVNNAAPDSGAVYLFSNPYTTPALSGILGKGYSGAGNFDVTALEGNDYFGNAVSLSATQLAVGALRDDGSGNAAPDSGAVYLFSTPYTTPSLSGILGKGYGGAGNFDVAALEGNDYFGAAVSLSATQLAVGALGDDGSGNVALDAGAVYLFDNPFTATSLSSMIGKGYGGAGDFDVAALEGNDYFGNAVSLSATQLVVGALKDDGSGNAATDSGAVYLFSNPYTTPALSGILGKGYGGAGNFDVSALEISDNFGAAVSLSLSGAQLAVGVLKDDGSGNAAPDSGAVYLFSTPYTTPSLSGILGKGYGGAGNFDVSALEMSDNFGAAVSLSATQLAVGALKDAGSGNAAANSGAVYLFSNLFGATSLNGVIGKGYSGAGNFDVGALENGDGFGNAVSLSATQLAVGAYRDRGSGNAAGESGAVYLFSNPYTTPALSGIFGKGYSGAGNFDVAALDASDRFGSAVSLSATQLAVGALGDDGSGNAAVDSGAVYLFDNPFVAATLSGVMGQGYTGAGNFNLTALEAQDNFGAAVSLSATQLAVGAWGDDGSGNAASLSGAVYLFDNPFGATSLNGVIGKGYTGTGNFDLAALEPFDQFGYSVSLSATQLAAGSWGDDGSGNAAASSGAVYLFNNPFSAATLSGIIGKGYSGAGDFNVGALEGGDQFGSAVSLSATQLAVGAYWDDGSGNAATDSGAVYLFNDPFTATSLSGVIGKGYSGAGNFNAGGVENGDQFGVAVSLSATQLAVGANGDDGSGNAAADSGAVYLFTLGGGAPASGQTFASNSALDSTLAPSSITAILNTGTALTLQASNDITQQAGADILVNNPSGNGGNFTLQAGRSILLNANITTDNGNLTLIANDTAASGVVNAGRDAGAALIQTAAAANIGAGSGHISLLMRDGAGISNAAAGAITLDGGLTGNNIDLATVGGIVQNGALNAAGDVNFNAAQNITLGNDLTAGHSIQLAAVSGDLTQTRGTIQNTSTATPGAITLSGRDVTLTAVKSLGDVSVTASRNITLGTGTTAFGGVGAMNFKGIDDQFFTYSLPFAFPFYGASDATAYISSNGLITFGSGTSSYSNSATGLGSLGRGTVASAWDDWVTWRCQGGGAGCSPETNWDVYVLPSTNSVAVRWDVGHYSDSSVHALFETVLRDDGSIQYNYGPANIGTNLQPTPTLGVSKGDGIHSTISSLNPAGSTPLDMNFLNSTQWTYNTATGNYVETVLSSRGIAGVTGGGVSGVAGQNVSLSAPNGALLSASGLTDVTATGNLNVQSASGVGTSLSPLKIAAGTLNLTHSGSGPVNLLTAGGIGIQDLISPGQVSLASSGNVAVTGDLGAQSLSLNGGVLDIAGADSFRPGTLTLLNGAKLQGAGTLSGNLVNTSGVIAPGYSPGLLTVTGNFTQGGSGALNIDLGGAGAGQSDKLAVAGNVILGGVLNASLVGGYTPAGNDAISFLTAGGTVTGAFATVNAPPGLNVGYNLFPGEAARLTYLGGSGANYFTNGGGNLNWGTAANWSQGALPDSADEVLIDTGFAVAHASGSDFIQALTIRGGNSLNLTGGALTVSGLTTLEGALSVNGGTFSGGAVNVDRGFLDLYGPSFTASTVNLLNGGRLHGTNTMIANLVNQSGVFSPGHSPGVLNITGDYTQAAGGVLVFEIGGSSPGSYDALNVSGNASFLGTVQFTLTNGFVPGPGDTFNFFNIGGSFANSASVIFPPGYTFSLVDGVSVVTGTPGTTAGPGVQNGIVSVISAGQTTPGGLSDPSLATTYQLAASDAAFLGDALALTGDTQTNPFEATVKGRCQ